MEMEYQQEAPLNLSLRQTQDVFYPNPTKLQGMEWNPEFSSARGVVQSPILATEVAPWCYQVPWAGFLPHQFGEQNMQFQQIYWTVVLNLFRNQFRAVSPPALPDPRALQDLAPVLVSQRKGRISSSPSEIFSLSAQAEKDAPPRNNDCESVLIKLEENSKTQKKEKKAALTDGKSFKCDKCGVSYPHRFELNRHVKVSHVRPHRCEHCGKGFGHKNYLHVHIETVHLGKKLHECQLCGKRLSTGGNLSVHVRTIHMGERRYKCEICSRTFGQQCNMKTHMKRHFCKPSEK